MLNHTTNTYEDGSTEKWDLPQPVEEVKAEIQELIDFGTNELDEIKENRIKAFEILRENNLEHYL